ncbi:MAG: hypothetical protein R3199_10705 [Gemmatimonadota bacterium]|nr:hypothetical protein [Gemmatimonadota bacterium]
MSEPDTEFPSIAVRDSPREGRLSPIPVKWLRAPDLSQDPAQSLVEYGILVSLIAVVVIVALAVLGDQLLSLFQGIVDQLPFG